MTATAQHTKNELAIVPEAKSAVSASAIHSVITAGDLSVLNERDRTLYYMETCDVVGLNWRTTPFVLAKMKTGGMKLYLTADGAEQLAKINRVNVEVVSAQEVKGTYIVHMKATDPSGRSVTKMGGKSLAGLNGEAVIDAMKKAETQAYRRAVKALCSLSAYERGTQEPPLFDTEAIATAAEVVAGVTVEAEASADPDTGEIEDAEWSPIADETDDTAAASVDQLAELTQAARYTYGFAHRNELRSWLIQLEIDPDAMTVADFDKAMNAIRSENEKE